MDKVELDSDERKSFRKVVEKNLSEYEISKRDKTASVDVLADRILDGLNDLLSIRQCKSSAVGRVHPEDVGDEPGFVHIKV